MQTEKDNPLEESATPTGEHRRNRSYLSRNRESSDANASPGTKDKDTLPTLLEIEQSTAEIEIIKNNNLTSLPASTTTSPPTTTTTLSASASTSTAIIVSPRTSLPLPPVVPEIYPYTLPPLTQETDLVFDIQCENLDSMHMLLAASPFIEIYLCSRVDGKAAALMSPRGALGGNDGTSSGTIPVSPSNANTGGTSSGSTQPNNAPPRKLSITTTTASSKLSSTSIRSRGHFYDSIYRSETHLRGGSNPQFKRAIIPAVSLCLGSGQEEYDRMILIRIYDESRDGEQNLCMGEVEFKLRDIMLGLYGSSKVTSTRGLILDNGSGSSSIQPMKLPLIRQEMLQKKGYTNSGFICINSVSRYKKLDRIPTHINGSSGTASELGTSTHKSRKNKDKSSKDRYTWKKDDLSSALHAAQGGSISVIAQSVSSMVQGLSAAELARRKERESGGSVNGSETPRGGKDKDKDREREKRRRSGKKKSKKNRGENSVLISDTDTGLSEMENEESVLDFPSVFSPSNAGGAPAASIAPSVTLPTLPSVIPIPFSIKSPPHFLSYLSLSANSLPKPAWYSLSDPHPFITIFAKSSVMDGWKKRKEGKLSPIITPNKDGTSGLSSIIGNPTAAAGTASLKRASRRASKNNTPIASRRGSTVLLPDETWISVYTSEIKRDTLSPEFEPFLLDLSEMSNTDWDTPIQISISYSNSIEKVVKPDIIEEVLYYHYVNF